MTRRRAYSALVAGFMLVASTGSARAQAGSAAAVSNDGPESPGGEPLPTTSLPTASPAAQTLPVLWPAQPQVIHEKRLWLAMPGGVVFGLSYGIAAIVGAIFALSPSAPANSVSDDIACYSTCRKQGAL